MLCVRPIGGRFLSLWRTETTSLHPWVDCARFILSDRIANSPRQDHPAQPCGCRGSHQDAEKGPGHHSPASQSSTILLPFLSAQRQQNRTLSGVFLKGGRTFGPFKASEKKSRPRKLDLVLYKPLREPGCSHIRFHQVLTRKATLHYLLLRNSNSPRFRFNQNLQPSVCHVWGSFHCSVFPNH